MNDWPTEWPTEPGWYWFYGRRSAFTEQSELFPTRVFKASNSVVYVASGGFIYQEEGATGIWQLMTLPELPT